MAGTTRRPPHTQLLSLSDRLPPKQLENVQFIAHVDATSLKFDRHRALLMTFVVPSEFAELALDMRFMAGVPLSVDVQKWKVVDHPSNGHS